MGHNTLIAAGSALVQFLSKDYRDFLSAGFIWHKVSKDYIFLTENVKTQSQQCSEAFSFCSRFSLTYTKY